MNQFHSGSITDFLYDVLAKKKKQFFQISCGFTKSLELMFEEFHHYLKFVSPNWLGMLSLEFG